VYKKEINRDVFFEAFVSSKNNHDFKKEKNFCQKGVIISRALVIFVRRRQFCSSGNSAIEL